MLKNRRKGVLKVLLVIISLMHFLYSESKPSKGIIGLLLSDLTLERWAKDRDYFIGSAHAQGFEVIVRNANNDQELQNSQADTLIQKGVKVIVVVPVDENKSAYIVEKAHTANIKVIAYDRLIMNCDLDAYVSYDNKMVGEIMAIYITIRVKNGNFAFIGGPKSDRNSFYIRQGIWKIIGPMIERSNISMVCDTFTNNWSKDEAYKIFNEYLSSGRPLPSVIFTCNDQLALGVINALEQKGLAGRILVSGQDAEMEACKNLVSGKQVLTIFKPARVLADRAAQTASGIIGNLPFIPITEINNGKVNVPSIILFPVPVDKNNLKNTVIKEGYQNEKDIFQ
jgi:D-xylose transport system substrate-binding protein